jgi:hypothetical protein
VNPISVNGFFRQVESSTNGGYISKSTKMSKTTMLRGLSALLGAAFLLLIPGFAAAQSSLPQARISAAIDESQTIALKGNIHSLARPQNDKGAADTALKLERITITFQPTAAQKADLDGLLAAQQNPTSPSFHQWLTPQQYGDRFGIAPADLAKVKAWLESKGFVVVETPASRNSIIFNGTAAQVSAAFHTQIHNYESKGEKFYANSSEPSVPAALAGMVAGFRGLNNVRLKPRAIFNKPSSGNIKSHFTSSVSGNNYISPGDFATIYDLDPLYHVSPAIDGTGQKIVVVGQSDIVAKDIDDFRLASNLLATNLQQILITTTDPGVVNGDVQESSLDIEWAGAVARNAKIIFVISNNGVFDSLSYAVAQNLAPVISISYGACESSATSAEVQSLVLVAQQANSQGITIVAATGDGGATDCDNNQGNYPAQLGLSVDIPASLPYITAVGGTEFSEGTGTYWQPQGTSDINPSALSYIPETTWNDTLLDGKPSSGGGGASYLFGKPSWQAGTGVPADGARDIPDISLNASADHDPYLYCTQFIPSGGTVLTSSCLNGTFRYSDGSLETAGGTSFGAPTFAGIVALINQATGSTGQGNINYILYPLAALTPTAFNDITTGDNKIPCIQGSPNCPDTNPIGYSAGLGYDQATGLGTIDATNLVNSWSSITTASCTLNTTCTPMLSSINPTTIAAGSPDFTLTATGTNFTTNAQILWNGSPNGVTMLTGGTDKSITATISHTLVANGTSTAGTVGATSPLTTTFVTVADNTPKAGVPSAPQPFFVTSAPPPNDNIASAIPITSSNFTSVVDNSSATTEGTDPDIGALPAPVPPLQPCVTPTTTPQSNFKTKTVWWTIQSTGTASVTLSTIGSSYDTTLSVWRGNPGSLVNVACNDDILSGQIRQSQLTFGTTAQKYYIMVAPFGPGDAVGDQAGGQTVLNVTGAAVALAPPVYTSATSTTFTAGIFGSFQMTATGSPAPLFTTSGPLPSGVTLNAITGVLSGIPAPGSLASYPITIFMNQPGIIVVQQAFTLNINQVPTITSGNNTTFFDNAPGSVNITTAGTPTPTLSEAGALPTGVNFTPGSGAQAGTAVLGGTPTQGGIFVITLTAHNGIGQDATQQFTLTVDAPPAITSASSANFTVGILGTFTVIATGPPTPTLSISGDTPPTGVTFNTATGVLSGTPAAGTANTYHFIFTATAAPGGVGTPATQPFTLTVAAPVLSPTPASQSVAAGSPATFMIADSGSATYALTCSGLGTGMSCGAVSVAPGASASLVISTTSRTLAAVPPAPRGRNFHINLWPSALMTLAAALAMLFAARKRKVLALLPLGSLALLVVFAVAGCGSGSGGGPTTNPNGTPVGSYVITVTGTAAGSATQTTTVTLNVT